MKLVYPKNTPRVIAANVRRLRREEGWKQAEAAEELHAMGGPLWSKASWSYMERSAENDRVKAFTAEEIAWLALLFDVPIAELFKEPPPPPEPCSHCDGTGLTGGAP